MAELELQPTAEERDEFQMDDGDGKPMLVKQFTRGLIIQFLNVFITIFMCLL